MWWGRGSQRQRSEALAGAPLAKERGDQVAPEVTLRPMNDADYVGFRTFMDEDYAQVVARAMDLSIEDARALAAKQLADLLKNGLATEGHHLWKIMTDHDGAVGDPWTFVDPAKRT